MSLDSAIVAMERIHPETFPLQPESVAATESALERARRELPPVVTGTLKGVLCLALSGVASAGAVADLTWGHKAAAQALITVVGGLGGIVVGIGLVFAVLLALASTRQRDELRADLADARTQVYELWDYIFGEENPDTVIANLTRWVNQAIQERQMVEIAWAEEADMEFVIRMLDWKLEVVTYLGRVARLFVADFQIDARMTYGAESGKERLLHEWEQRITCLREIIRELRAGTRAEMPAYA